MSRCDGCDSAAMLAQQKLVPFEIARQRLLADAAAIKETQTISVDHALGRVLAQSVIAAINVPPADNSAMDGYAFRYSDLVEGGCLPLGSRVAAGDTAPALADATLSRIFTGAEIPEGADTVVMQENCTDDGQQVRINVMPRQGDNIRPCGQDIAQGDTVLTAGVRLGPQHLGMLASIGVHEVTVYRRLKVALLTTGDELVMPGQALNSGQIYNSNLYTLRGLLEALGCEVIYPGIVADTMPATLNALSTMAKQADCIISSGGVSVGDEDHVRGAVEKLGLLNLWRLAIKPGKPFAQGQVEGTPFIGVPGNPSAAFVTFLILARPYLLTLQGVAPEQVLPLEYPVLAGFSRDKKIGRQEYLRVSLVADEKGLTAVTALNQSSGALRSATVADGLFVVPANTSIVEGQALKFIPFDSLIN